MVTPSYEWRLALHAMDLDSDGHDGATTVTPLYLWKPLMVDMPNIQTTDGQPVYQPLVTTDGEAIMVLVPVS